MMDALWSGIVLSLQTEYVEGWITRNIQLWELSLVVAKLLKEKPDEENDWIENILLNHLNRWFL